jgi:hypothetical protein
MAGANLASLPDANMLLAEAVGFFFGCDWLGPADLNDCPNRGLFAHGAVFFQIKAGADLIKDEGRSELASLGDARLQALTPVRHVAHGHGNSRNVCSLLWPEPYGSGAHAKYPRHKKQTADQLLAVRHPTSRGRSASSLQKSRRSPHAKWGGLGCLPLLSGRWLSGRFLVPSSGSRILGSL